MSHSSELMNLRRGLWEFPQDFIVGHSEVRVAWTCHWHLKWGQSCGTEPLTWEVCINSKWQWGSELIWIVQHLVGVQRVGQVVGVRQTHTHWCQKCYEEKQSITTNRSRCQLQISTLDSISLCVISRKELKALGRESRAQTSNIVHF